MSDRFSGQIWIGGQVSRAPRPRFQSTVVALVGEINNAGVSETWGDGEVAIPYIDDAHLLETELLQYLDDDGFLYFCDDKATNGEFDSLEGFCRGNDIPFRRVSDHYCEYDAEELIFVPGHDEITRIVGAGCKPLVDGDEVREALEELGRANLESDPIINNFLGVPLVRFQRAMELLKRLCPDIPTIPKFEIVD